jgi:hypothetical protein
VLADKTGHLAYDTVFAGKTLPRVSLLNDGGQFSTHSNFQQKIGNVLDKLVLAVNCPQHIKHQISKAGARKILVADTPENQSEVTLK